MNILESLTVAINSEKDEIEIEKTKGQSVLSKVPNQISKADLLFNDVLDKYMMISKTGKEDVKKFITVETAWYLLGFGIRMATYSLRLSDQRYFTNGLMALSIVVKKLDQREILLILPLYYDVHKKHNLSFHSSLVYNDEFSVMLEDFLYRDEVDKTIECMGYVLSEDENDNPFYERTW